MSDERTQLRLANSCNILSEVSAELPNTLPWLDSTDVDKCHNLIGNDISHYRGKTFADNEFFYDYLKTEIRDKRKMGHLTTIEK